jgi:TolB-like protein/Tfp pilus assembly protein PilF
MNTNRISLGDITVDLDRNELRRGDERLQVSQRAVDLLRALVASVGQAVSKATLMEAAWPGQIVEEGNLTVQIAALRKALGPMPDGNDWIVTVPRVGYRLLRPSTPVREQAETIVLPSLAVLPFANLNGDPEQHYFAEGIVEDIITALSRFKSFVVTRSLKSANYGEAVDFRQFARDLGVRYVLTGSVRRAIDRLRISAQLIDGETGAHLWARNFDGVSDEVFRFQDEITECVAMVVEPYVEAAELGHSRRERPGSIAAYDLYLRAMPKFNSQSVDDSAEAYALLMEAVNLEPDNPLFLANAARAIGHRGAMGWPPIGPHDREISTQFVERALLLAADDAVVLAYCGISLIHFIKDYDKGMEVIRSAVEVNPNNLMVVNEAGVANLHCGTIPESLAHFHRVIKLSPRDTRASFSLTGIAHAHMILGNYSEALTWASRSQVLNANFNATLWILVAANALLGNMAEARRFLQQLRDIAPDVTIASIRAGQPAKDPSRNAAILEGLRMAGLPEE